MGHKIAVIGGDGIGPEIMVSALEVFKHAMSLVGETAEFTEYLAGGVAFDRYGTPLPTSTIEGCKGSTAVLLGAVGGPKWDELPSDVRPEKALLGLRHELGLYANLRPGRLFPALKSRSPLRADIATTGFDIMMVRELTGGIYFGENGERTGKFGHEAYDTEVYSEFEVERIGRVAFEIARGRTKKLVSVDKANVLKTSQLWRSVMHRVAADYPDIEYSDMLVDNAAMQLVKCPAQFCTIVTSNMFGDMLSDELAQLTGSIGLLASVSKGDGCFGMYEPIHGSAPDLVGKNVANPIAMILSTAFLARYSLKNERLAHIIENAVSSALEAGVYTGDVSGDMPSVSTAQMTSAIIERMV